MSIFDGLAMQAKAFNDLITAIVQKIPKEPKEPKKPKSDR